jgi:hypothetical protein
MCEEWVGMGGASRVGAVGVTSGSVDGAADVAVVAAVGGSKSNEGTAAVPITIEGVELELAGAACPGWGARISTMLPHFGQA